MDFRLPDLTREASLSILLTNNSEIATLNSRYRNQNKATDVLSFSMLEDGGLAGEHCTLGDLVISVEKAAAQAEQYDVNLYQEILRLLIHGVLHLAGYDHENVSAATAQEMRDREEEIYQRYLDLAKGMIE